MKKVSVLLVGVLMMVGAGAAQLTPFQTNSSKSAAQKELAAVAQTPQKDLTVPQHRAKNPCSPFVKKGKVVQTMELVQGNYLKGGTLTTCLITVQQ